MIMISILYLVSYILYFIFSFLNLKLIDKEMEADEIVNSIYSDLSYLFNDFLN